MNLSQYQEAIIEWAKTKKGHGCCNAVAGSGKSTTLRLVAKALEESGFSPSDIKVCVFGKANSLDLIKKFGKAWEQSISTLHSAGWNLLKKHLNIQNPKGLIKNNKYRIIAQDLGLIAKRGKTASRLRDKGAITKDDDFVTLLDLVRLTNSVEELETDTVKTICKHFELSDIWNFSYVTDAIIDVIDEGEFLAHKGQFFDFCDQIWLPVRWELGKEKWFEPYQFVLVDECQDLNAAQLELALSLAGTDGRILAVGDPRQAIMGFAGADNRSYQKIVERLQATELPLSICYRCPKSHIDLVKQNFPEIPIEANPNAIEGKIEAIFEHDLWSEKPCRLIENDMVICRKTAPLVSLCIKLIARGIAATVKGRAIGEQIKGDLQEIGKMPGFRYENFNDAVNAYRMAKIQRYQGLDNEEQLIEALSDKLEALTTIYKSQPQATAITHLEDYIDSLFSDEHSPITLSTCHRAKGLEGERIFIIKPDDMPMTWRNQQDWQKEQEDNLLYVALTRSKSELYIVGQPNWLIQEEQPAEPETVNPLQCQSEDQTQEQFPEHLKAFEKLVTVNNLQCEDQSECDDKPATFTCPVVECPRSLDNKHEKLKETLMADPSRSDRAIAGEVGVSAPTVAKWRKRLIEQGLIDSDSKRTDKRGRRIETESIGTKEQSTQQKIAKLVENSSSTEIEEIIEFLKKLL